jgi:hypothetical protein
VGAVLDQLYIVSARNVIVNGQVILGGDLIQEQGAETTVFNQDVTAGRHVDITVTGAITVQGALQSNHGDVTLAVDQNNASGLIEVNSARVLDGDLIIQEARNVAFQARVTVSGAISQAARS